MFERLIQLVSPPVNPIEAPSTQRWQEVESKLGLKFPQGSGAFHGTVATDISFYNPGSETFPEEIKFECQRYRDENEGSDNEAIPYPIYPEIHGVLPIAVDRNDNHVYWRTDSQQQNWSIIVQWAWTATNTRVFVYSFPEFVERMFFRELNVVCWREPWFLDNVQFEERIGGV